MKLLINLCAHDGIISHYNGVGTMCIRYIKCLDNVLKDLNIGYDLNLFTPCYNKDAFGYNEKLEKEHTKNCNTKIYRISNGSNGTINYGTISNWKELCKNTANIINNLDLSEYDKIITIYNDTPFACLANYLNISDNHITVSILHSTIKIHEVDSAIENSELFYNDRLNWENDAIKFINKSNNSYMAVVGEFIQEHLINEYNLNYQKVLKLYNGEILEYENYEYSIECKKLFSKIKDLDNIVLSFGRAEKYKNLSVSFKIGKLLNIKSVVIAQLYYKEQPIAREYIKDANDHDGILYIDPPFEFANYILNNFKGKIICLLPSKKEIQGLIINEIRKLNNKNILIVANNINGLKEQIEDGYDGIIVDVDNLEESSKKIRKYFYKDKMTCLNINSQKTLALKFDLYKNVKNFFIEILSLGENNGI